MARVQNCVNVCACVEGEIQGLRLNVRILEMSALEIFVDAYFREDYPRTVWDQGPTALPHAQSDPKPPHFFVPRCSSWHRAAGGGLSTFPACKWSL